MRAAVATAVRECVRCGCPQSKHEHYRAGSDCPCGCPRFRGGEGPLLYVAGIPVVLAGVGLFFYLLGHVGLWVLGVLGRLLGW